MLGHGCGATAMSPFLTLLPSLIAACGPHCYGQYENVSSGALPQAFPHSSQREGLRLAAPKNMEWLPTMPLTGPFG